MKFETKTFKKDDLREIIYSRVGKEIPAEDGSGTFKMIEDEIVDTSRWSIHKSVVFSFKPNDGFEQFYRVSFSEGATENQDERPFDDEDDDVVCYNVRPRPKTIIEFVPVEKGD